MNILIAEDDRISALLLSTAIENLGHQAFIQSDGLKAQDFLKCNPNKIDVLITDYQMPHINGLQLIHWVRNCPALHQPHFILVSSMTILEITKDKRCDFQFFQKPINIEILNQTLKQIKSY